MITLKCHAIKKTNSLNFYAEIEVEKMHRNTDTAVLDTEKQPAAAAIIANLYDKECPCGKTVSGNWCQQSKQHS